jgi:tetratricopeptide (TPR) repeat protein
MKKLTIIVFFVLLSISVISNAEIVWEIDGEIMRLLRDGQEEKAIELCDESLKKWSEHPALYYRKGRILSRLDRDKEAIEFFDLAIKYNQEPFMLICMGQLYFFKGQSLEALGQFEEALKNYNLAIEHGYDDRWVYFAISDVEYKLRGEGK